MAIECLDWENALPTTRFDLANGRSVEILGDHFDQAAPSREPWSIEIKGIRYGEF